MRPTRATRWSRIASSQRSSRSSPPKGLQPADHAHADLIATYTAGARTKQELQSTWDGGYWGPGFDDWYWGGAGYGDVWIEEYREGTLVIDLIDASTKKLVWRGIAKAENKNFRSADYIDKAVDKTMEKYPPVPGSSSAKMPETSDANGDNGRDSTGGARRQAGA